MKTSVSKVEKICPGVEELSAAPKTNVSCPMPGCNKLCYSSAMLQLHKAKVHGIDKVYLQGKAKDVTYHYHCPVKGCLYNPDSERHFATIKLLKQHYRKMHLEKKFLCTKCQKGFGVKCDKERHEKTCGTVYHCVTCSCVYTTREALLTHCTRHNHTKPTWNQSETAEKTRLKKSPPPTGGPVFIIVQNSSNSQLATSFNVEPTSLNCRPVLPKPVVHTLPPLKNLTIGPDKIFYEMIADRNDRERQAAETQTNIYGVDHLCVSTENDLTSLSNTDFSEGLQQPTAVRSSTEVQTSLSIRPNRQKFCSAAETQTPVDEILRSAMESAEIPIQRQMSTQYMTLDFKQFKSSEVQISLVPKKKCKRKQNLICRDVGAVYNTSTSEDLLSMVDEFGSSISTQTQQSFLENVVCSRNEQLQSAHTQTNLSSFTSEESVGLQRHGSAAKRKSKPHRLTSCKKRKAAAHSVEMSFLPQFNIGSSVPFQNNYVCQVPCSPLNRQISNAPQTFFSSPCEYSQIKRLGTISSQERDVLLCDGDFFQHSRPTEAAHESAKERSHHSAAEGVLGMLNQTSQDSTSYAMTFEGMEDIRRPDFLDLADQLSGGDRVVSHTLVVDSSVSRTTMTQITPLKASGTQTSVVGDMSCKRCSVAVSAIAPGTEICTQTAEPAAMKDLSVQTCESPVVTQTVSLSLLDSNSPVVDTMESSVQTLTSSTDLDQLVRSEIQKSMLKQTSGTDIHTQTADELLDFLMFNMETQTSDKFCGFSDTETQTTSLQNTWLESEKRADNQTTFSSAGNQTSSQEMAFAQHTSPVQEISCGQHTSPAKDTAPAQEQATTEAWSHAGRNVRPYCPDNPWLYSPVSAETQTASGSGLWLNSVTAAETQTTLQPLMDISDEDMTLCMDMETQTHFSIVDDSICDFTDSHTQTTFNDLTSLFSP